jgi:maleate isomerase
MAFSSWRGVVGMINPTLRPGVTEEVIRLLPEGIGLIPLFLNIRRGTADEFESMMPAYEELVAVLADAGCDLIHPHGAPPFMVQGRKREAAIVKAWEKKYKTPIMSVAQNHVNALTALGAKSFVGATYFPPKLNAVFAKYFRDAGFRVRGMEGIDVPFDKVQELSTIRSMPTSSATSSRPRAPTRSTCWAPGGARSISSRHWSRTCRCRWCIR